MIFKQETNKKLAKYIYDEFKKKKVEVKRNNVMVYAKLNNKTITVDCLAGKVFVAENEKEKSLCSLTKLSNEKHSRELHKCAANNVENILKKINSKIKRVDLRTKKSVVDLRTKGFNKVIVYINKKIYENKSIFLAIKNFFFEEYETTDEDFIETYKEEYIENFGSAYKDDMEKEILIDKQTLKNLSYSEFYDILHNKYPDFYIQNYFTGNSSKNNRIIKRLAEKNYNKSAYDWVKDRAELLIDKEDMSSDMAYGIAWIQYKNKFCDD
jgi:hypothetical protein